MMFVVLLWVCIHTGQAEMFAWHGGDRTRDSHRGQENQFSACPVWMCTQSNTTNIKLYISTVYNTYIVSIVKYLEFFACFINPKFIWN